ncbi:alpha/beta hydrolase family protein [Aeromicrobium sp.]|uniref:alpha/beta hydrolase n=1 Tax=Aeromicrobium sp. TaxID=1871063 RepID=UPI0030C334F9
MRRFLAAGLLTAALVAPAASAAAEPDPVSGHGLTVTDTTRPHERIVETTVSTAALEKPVRIRVVLPEGYDATAKRYPVLYLYHGTSGRPSDWTGAGDALRTSEGKDVILVLPEAGYDGNGGGWFVNWVNPLGTRQMWETFELDQVIPWVDANYRTVADRDHRAIAGLSQGGFGAMHAAARRPDQFTSVATFSGAPEIYRDPVVRAGASLVIEGTNVALNGGQPFQMFGDPVLNGVHWQGHDPGTLVENLRGMDINLWTATGLPGERDTLQSGLSVSGNVIESLTHLSNQAFRGHLRQAGIPHHFDNYVFGTHSFPYWAQDLREYLPGLMDRFASPSTPSSITYSSIDKAYTQWGWGVLVQRRPAERLTTLSGADAAGFGFVGGDPATVVTPPLYAPGAVKSIRLTRYTSTSTRNVTADASGRLTIAVPGTSTVSIG